MAPEKAKIRDISYTNLMRRFDFVLCNTSADDVSLFRDFFSGAAQDSSVGVHAAVIDIKG